MLSALDNAGLRAEVKVLQAVNDAQLRGLYSMAKVFLFPSLEEGFGWPILEAQACGCPVVTTNQAPMRDTGGGAALYADEGDWASVVQGVLEMEAARRAAIVAAGIANARRFPLNQMAGQYVRFYAGILSP